MFAHLVEFEFGAAPGLDVERRFVDEAEDTLAVEAEQILRTQSGCEGVATLEDDRELYTLSLWDSRDQAEAATAVLREYLQGEGIIWWLAMNRPPVFRITEETAPELALAGWGERPEDLGSI